MSGSPGGVAVDQGAPAHAEVQAEVGAGAVGVEQGSLPAAGGAEPVAGERGRKRGGGETALLRYHASGASIPAIFAAQARSSISRRAYSTSTPSGKRVRQS